MVLINTALGSYVISGLPEGGVKGSRRVLLIVKYEFAMETEKGRFFLTLEFNLSFVKLRKDVGKVFAANRIHLVDCTIVSYSNKSPLEESVTTK
jgi:hypothetical protein